MRLRHALFAAGLLLTAGPAAAQLLDPAPYDTGTPAFTDLWVGPGGDDGNAGTVRSAPLQTLGVAWARVPARTAGTGYRINLLPGTYPCEGDCANYFGGRHGSFEAPVVVRAADGPGTVVLLGGLNVADVRYLYLVDLTMRAGAGASLHSNNVLRVEAGDHVLLRHLTLIGPGPHTHPDNYDVQEVVKVNQSSHVYLEGSDVSGAYQTGVDFFSVQHGHLLDNRIHGAGEWCLYLKGGSAYFQIAGNELYGCGLGFQAGEGSNFEVMRTPWVHYEAYDVKFFNNVLHDIPGTGLGVAGGYNILLAHNTLYRVGTFDDGSERGYALVNVGYGGRVCADFSENGEGNAPALCGGLIDQGGWGTAVEGYDSGGDWIPSRNVYVYNNLFYNPSPERTRYTHFAIREPVDLPARARNLPPTVSADVNLQIRGNLVWNGPPDHPLGVGEAEGGCPPANATCNPLQVAADNTINTVAPRLIDPATGDFRPSPGSLKDVRSFTIPPFSWADAPQRPVVPPGTDANTPARDRGGRDRGALAPAGAYTDAGSVGTEHQPGTGGGFSLSPNYPNPFTVETALPFAVAVPGPVVLRVFDLLGREVARPVDAVLPAGAHTARLDGRSLAAGLYACRLETPAGTVAWRLVARR